MSLMFLQMWAVPTFPAYFSFPHLQHIWPRQAPHRTSSFLIMRRSYSLNIKNPIRKKNNPNNSSSSNTANTNNCNISTFPGPSEQVGSYGEEGGPRMRLFPAPLQSGILSKSSCYLHLSEDGSIPTINTMSMTDLGPSTGVEGDYASRASWIRIAVLGHKGVGKTALTVRYLTGRFIGEYSPLERIYIHKTLSSKDNSPVWVEIRDMAFADEESLLSELSSNWICDGYLLVFSLSNERSLPLALTLAQIITKEFIPPDQDMTIGSRQPPVLLVANKKDLHPLLKPAAEFTLRDKCQGLSWVTTSAREDSSSVQEAFNSLIQMIASSRLDPNVEDTTTPQEDWNLNAQAGGAGSLLSPGQSATLQRKRKPSTRFMESFNKMFGSPKSPGKS